MGLCIEKVTDSIPFCSSGLSFYEEQEVSYDVDLKIEDKVYTVFCNGIAYVNRHDDDVYSINEVYIYINYELIPQFNTPITDQILKDVFRYLKV